MDTPSLRDYQIGDLAFMIANPKCMLLGDPGTGKTPPVCVMQWHMWQTEGISTVWIMPKSLLNKNRDEILRFTGFKPEQVVIIRDPKGLTDSQRKLMEDIISGTLTQLETCKGSRKTTLRRLMNEGLVEYSRGELRLTDAGEDAFTGTPKEFLREEVAVYLMGFTRFAKCYHQLPKRVKAVHIDEFHLGFKSNDSARTQALYQFAEGCKYFVPMTGTLIDGRLDTAYPAIKIIEPRYYLSHEAFMNFHAYRDEYDRVLWWTNHDKLSEILSRHGIRRTFEMVYGQSKVVIIPEIVHMSEAHRAMYDQLHDAAYLELEKFFVDGAMPGVHLIRCRQLMEHPNRFPDLTNLGAFTDVLPGEEPAKMERLAIQIEEHKAKGTPFPIFSSLVPQQAQIAALLDAFKMPYGVMNGDTSGKERAQIDEAFVAGKIQALVCSPPVAGVGFNWQFWKGREVENIAFVTLDYQDTSFAQAIRRFERGPRKSSLRVSVYQYADSIDQRVMEIVRTKSKMANMVDATRQVFDLAA